MGQKCGSNTRISSCEMLGQFLDDVSYKHRRNLLIMRYLTAILRTFAICSVPLLGQTRIKHSDSNPIDALTLAPSLVAASIGFDPRFIRVHPRLISLSVPILRGAI